MDGGVIADGGGFEITVELGPGELRPGLVNAHDHLHRNHFPRLGQPPYRDAYAWGDDLHDRWSAEVERARALDRRSALLFGALKNLIAGVTTVAHHDRWEPAFETGFPVRVPRLRLAHALGTEPDVRASALAGDPSLPFCIHLAEGTTPAAADEVRRLETLGLLGRSLLAVHCVGVDADGAARLRRSGAAIVWCPTSNAFLFGRTAPEALLRSGIDVLVGSDSLLTGAGTLLDELRAARVAAILSDAALEAGVGATAARRLGLPEPALGRGSPADLVHLARPLLQAGGEDVQLVIVGGTPRYADVRFAPLFELAGVPVEELRVGSRTRIVAAPLGAIAAEVVAGWPECGRVFGDDGSADP